MIYSSLKRPHTVVSALVEKVRKIVSDINNSRAKLSEFRNYLTSHPIDMARYVEYSDYVPKRLRDKGVTRSFSHSVQDLFKEDLDEKVENDEIVNSTVEYFRQFCESKEPELHPDEDDDGDITDSDSDGDGTDPESSSLVTFVSKLVSYVQPKSLITDVVTRWNSTFYLLRSVLMKRKAITHVYHEFSPPAEVETAELGNNEWWNELRLLVLFCNFNFQIFIGKISLAVSICN